jgi:CubicO group peptidase (beta-lactamase class C family)
MTRRTPLPRSTPEAQGVSSAALLRLVDAMDARLHDAHSVMVVRHGHVVAEGWWAPYSADAPHSLFSVSKSFTSAAVGFAVEEGLVGLDDRVVDLLPDDLPPIVPDNLAAMRVRHLLTMTTGHATDTVGTLTEHEHDWTKTLLRQPVPLAPGTTFVYDTGATHLLSAILQRRTGERLLDFLTPRLLEPLGIEDATWEQSPVGVDAGGWGLSITTEDIAAFGLTYLDGGRWRGRQVVPAGWVAESTAVQVANGDGLPGSDWAQGYGYQFWRSQHGAYRADGAFGQVSIAVPEHDTLLVMTAGLDEMQTQLDVVWEHLLPALEPSTALGSGTALPDDAAALAALAIRLSSLAIDPPEGAPSGATSDRVSGRAYGLPRNSAGLRSVALDQRGEHTTLVVVDAHGEHTIEVGSGGWSRGRSSLLAERETPIAAAGAWVDDAVYLVRIIQTETPFSVTIALDFLGDEVTVDVEQNVSFGPTRLLHTVGRADR